MLLNSLTENHSHQSIVADCGESLQLPPWYPLNRYLAECRLTDALGLLENWGHTGEEAIAVLRHFWQSLDEKGGNA